MNSMGIYQHHHHRPPRYVVVWIVAVAFVLGAAAALGTVRALPADATPPKQVKVTICHNGHPITVADDGYWGGHIHHAGDTLGACPVEPTEEPTPWPTTTPTADPTPSSSPSPTVTPTPEPSSSPEATASPEPAVSPSSHPGPSVSSTPTSVTPSSPGPSVMSTLSPLPVLPEAETSAVPYTAPAQLAATGMSDGMRAGVGVAVAFLAGGTFLYLVARRRGA
jgi:hypothetical protein